MIGRVHVERTMLNELGNQVTITADIDAEKCEVTVIGPRSSGHFRLTRKEFRDMMLAMTDALSYLTPDGDLPDEPVRDVTYRVPC